MRTALICLAVALLLADCLGQWSGDPIASEWSRWKKATSAATPVFPLPDHVLVDIDLTAQTWSFWDAVMARCKEDGYHCVLDPFREQVEEWAACCACVEKQGPGTVIPAGTPVGCAVPEKKIPSIRFAASEVRCGNCEELPWYLRDGQDPKRQVQVKVSRMPRTVDKSK